MDVSEEYMASISGFEEEVNPETSVKLMTSPATGRCTRKDGIIYSSFVNMIPSQRNWNIVDHSMYCLRLGWLRILVPFPATERYLFFSTTTRQALGSTKLPIRELLSWE
jgi:hypothetical protein